MKTYVFCQLIHYNFFKKHIITSIIFNVSSYMYIFLIDKSIPEDRHYKTTLSRSVHCYFAI